LGHHATTAGCAVVSKFEPHEAQKAAEKLVQKAQQRWQQENGAAVDDITALVIRPGFIPGTASISEEQAAV
jgi:hypothetical protein